MQGPSIDLCPRVLGIATILGYGIVVSVIIPVFILIQLVENTILVPQIMGRRLKLHPALVFIAIVSTLALFGMIAGLIVIPLLASIDLIVKHAYKKLVLPSGSSPGMD